MYFPLVFIGAAAATTVTDPISCRITGTITPYTPFAREDKAQTLSPKSAGLLLKWVRLHPPVRPDYMASSTTNDPNSSYNAPATASSVLFRATEWHRFTSPNGVVYYAYDQDRLLTTDEIHDPAMRESILRAYYEWKDFFEEIDAPDAEMFVFHAGDEPYIQFASWSQGRIYKFHPDGGLVFETDQQFWDYAWQLTMHRTRFPRFMETEFVSALAFGADESALDMKHTTFPYDDDQIKRLMRVYRQLRGRQNVMPESLVPALAYHVARTMFFIAAARSRCGYGTATVQLTVDTGIQEPTLTLAICDIFLGVLFCGTHGDYRARLACAVPGGSVSLPDFRQLMVDFMAEWADSNLVATVLVSVDIGFLTIQSITGLQRTSALASGLLATTSIVMGVHHSWQHRAKSNAELDDARRYLYHPHLYCRRRPERELLTAGDLTPTACVLALPHAALRWAVLGFAVAIASGAGRSLLVLLVPAVFLFFWGVWSTQGASSNVWWQRLRAAGAEMLKRRRNLDRSTPEGMMMHALRSGNSV
ncbi:hypothetical protein B0H17DRAFT_1065703 [Mycena rosella]|uniref:WW domain-containing protein n=1 Tax=Mycena rosella TaxID=1033263 RepID=A0AAD7DFH9_MYCRO|nr:hypothetical protein B0H17DRAFT_1065703 [Mycena rosella]